MSTQSTNSLREGLLELFKDVDFVILLQELFPGRDEGEGNMFGITWRDIMNESNKLLSSIDRPENMPTVEFYPYAIEKIKESGKPETAKFIQAELMYVY